MRLCSFILIIALHFTSFSIIYSQDVSLKLGDETLTLVLAFGCEAYGTKGDFLLESPNYVFTNDKNDIIVFDKYYIKIYDSKGNGKKIIGGRGQGPGEFDRGPRMYATSPAAYFSVLESAGYYSIFDNNLKFIDKRLIRNDKGFNEFLEMNKINPANIGWLDDMFVYGEKEKIYNFTFGSKPHFKEIILYDQGGKVKTILYKDNKNTVYEDPFLNVPDHMFGDIFYIPLPCKIIAYTDNSEEDYGDGKKGVYKIHIISCNDLSERIIIQQFAFAPKRYDGSYLATLRRSLLGGISDSDPNILRIKARFEMVEKFHNNKTYSSHIKYLRNDSIYIFALSIFWNPEDKKEYPVYYVFDALSGKHISTFQSPIILGHYIKNGYVYDTGMHTSGYYEIRVYKLNPKIYGK